VKQQEEQVEYEKKMAVYRAYLPSAAMVASQLSHVGNGGGQMEEEDDEEDEEYSDEEA
jgi:hypothetical protein